MRTWLTGVLLAILAALGAGAGLAAEEEDAEPSPYDAGFGEWFFAKNGFKKLSVAQTVYPASVRDNLSHAAALSTKDYLLVSTGTQTGMLAQPKSASAPNGCYYSDWWEVVDITPASFGAVAAELRVLAFPDSRKMIAGYFARWLDTQIEFNVYLHGLKKYDALQLGDLALGQKGLDVEKIGAGADKDVIEFFRNGVVVMAYGKDSGNFRYLRFLRDLDALLRHDGAGPAPAPGALTPDEYRQGVEKYRAWREAEAKKESERRAREWARRQAERAPAPGEPREVASEDRACPAPRAKKAPREGRHWLWRLFMGCGCPPRAGE